MLKKSYDLANIWFDIWYDRYDIWYDKCSDVVFKNVPSRKFWNVVSKSKKKKKKIRGTKDSGIVQILKNQS